MDIAKLRTDCTITAWSGADGKCQVCNSEISDKRRTVFCSKKCSLWWERNHVWRKARIATRRRDNYSCIICNSHKDITPIEVDHIIPVNGVSYNTPSCLHHQDNLQTLCKKHHNDKTSLEAKNRADLRRKNI